MIVPHESLADVMRELDAGGFANLEPARKSLDAAVRLRRYMTRKVDQIRALRAGRISAAREAERECERLRSLLPAAWQR